MGLAFQVRRSPSPLPPSLHPPPSPSATLPLCLPHNVRNTPRLQPSNMYPLHLTCPHSHPPPPAPQISAAAYMSAMALSAAVNTRVANELGSGDAAAARCSCWVGVAVVLVMQTSISAGIWLFGRTVVRWLSTDAAVEELTMTLVPVLSVTFIGGWPVAPGLVLRLWRRVCRVHAAQLSLFCASSVTLFKPLRPPPPA
jgi:hypothetical protein